MTSRIGIFKLWDLRRKLLGHTPQARSAALEELKTLGWRPESDAEQLAFLIEEGQWDQIRKYGERRCALGKEMLETSPYKTDRIARVLGKIRSSKAIPYLLRAMKRGDAWVTFDSVLAYEAGRRWAQQAARKTTLLGTHPASNPLAVASSLIDSSTRVHIRKACEHALISIAKGGADITPAVSRLAKSKKPWVRDSAARLLKTLQS